MKNKCTWLLLLLWIVPLFAGVYAQTTNPPAAHWTESKLAAFEEQEKRNPLPEGGILLIGSSTVEIWGRQHAFESTEPLIWHGVGGTGIPYLIKSLDRLLLSYKPARIVIYSGDNDLGDGKGGNQAADKTVNDMKDLVGLIRAKLPDTRIYILSIKCSIKRASADAVQQRANAGFKALVATTPNAEYVDVRTILMGEDGKPNPAYFAQDGLHLNRQGYEQWNRIMKEVLHP